ISYGSLGAAIVKLVGLLLFIDGLVFAGGLLFAPVLAWLLMVPVSWFLFSLLFDLNSRDLVCSVVGLWVLRLLLWLLLVQIALVAGARAGGDRGGAAGERTVLVAGDRRG